MEAINLNLIPNGTNPVVHCSQYDEGREFRFNLFDGASVFVLDGTEDIACDIKKPDGNIVTAAVPNTEDDYIIVTTTLQMCACSGNSLGTINISKGGVNLYTLNFVLYCERSPLENGIESDSAIHNLNTMVDEMVAEDVAEQYDSANVIFDNEPTDNHGIGYTVTSEGIKTAIDNAFDYDNTASGSIVHITDGADNIPVKALVSQIVAVESGNGQPKSPTNPYTISGYDNGVVSVCSVNLWDEDWELGNYDVITGAKSVNNNNARCKNPIPCKPNTQFYFKCSTNSGILFYDQNGTYISYTTGYNTIITTPSNAWFICFYVTSGYGTTYNNDISINYPSTDTQYHAYNGTTYTFAFGQTVYGGHFDNKGNLVVTHGGAIYDGSENWVYQAPNTFRLAIPTGAKPATVPKNCNMFTPSLSGADNTIFFSSANMVITSAYFNEDVNAFKTFLGGNNLKIVYELANPIVLPITSQDIPTLLGENNIFSNCGDVEVEYYTSKANDILEFIDSEIGKKNGTNIPIEEGSADSIKDYIDNLGLSGLSDTDISGESVGQVLTFDGDNWVNSSSLSDKIDEFSTWKTSTISFSKACESLGIYSGIGAVLDALKTNISGYTDATINNRVDISQGPVYGMIVFKANDNYFSGILLSYFASVPERQPIMYIYENGTYAVKRI